MDKKGIMIDNLCEIQFNGDCLGNNENMGHTINVVLRKNNKMLSREETLAIILHEITHCTYSEHDDQFIQLEQQLRENYIQLALQNGDMPPWNKIIFPISTGKALILSEDYQLIKYLCSVIVMLIIVIVVKLIINSQMLKLNIWI